MRCGRPRGHCRDGERAAPPPGRIGRDTPSRRLDRRLSITQSNASRAAGSSGDDSARSTIRRQVLNDQIGNRLRGGRRLVVRARGLVWRPAVGCQFEPRAQPGFAHIAWRSAPQAADFWSSDFGVSAGTADCGVGSSALATEVTRRTARPCQVSDFRGGSSSLRPRRAWWLEHPKRSGRRRVRRDREPGEAGGTLILGPQPGEIRRLCLHLREAGRGRFRAAR